MSKALHIGINDLRLFLKDKTSYIWLIGMPLAFAFVMSFSAREPREGRNARPEVYIENLDSGFLSNLFLDTLGREGVRPVGEERKGKAKRGIAIPEDFTRKILSKEQTIFEVFKMEDADDPRSMLVQVSVFRAAVAFNGYLVEHAKGHGANAPLTEESLQAIMDTENPVLLDARFAGRKPVPVGMGHSLPGNLVMYLMLNLMIFGGASIANERRNGVLKRLSINPIGKAELMGGKLFGLILLGCVQIIVFMILGQFVFGVNMGDQPVSIFLLLLVLSWVGASVGILIGFLLISEDKIIGVCLMIGLPMGALGGCWWPLEVVPETFQTVALTLPTGWALDGLHKLITFGLDINHLGKHFAVLAGFGLVANVLAARFFRV